MPKLPSLHQYKLCIISRTSWSLPNTKKTIPMTRTVIKYWTFFFLVIKKYWTLHDNTPNNHKTRDKEYPIQRIPHNHDKNCNKVFNFLRIHKKKRTCDIEKMSPGKKPNPLLSPRLSSPSPSLCKRECIRRPWLDPSLILNLGILSLGGELQSQQEDWDEATSGRREGLKRCFVFGRGLEMYDDEVESASMVVRWRFTFCDLSVWQ